MAKERISFNRSMGTKIKSFLTDTELQEAIGHQKELKRYEPQYNCHLDHIVELLHPELYDLKEEIK